MFVRWIVTVMDVIDVIDVYVYAEVLFCVDFLALSVGDSKG